MSAARLPVAQQPGPCEMKIDIRPRGMRFWEIEGTRGQIEAEGINPPGNEWPEGTRGRRWYAGQFSYFLLRARPAGMKGPMKLWAAGDWWRLRCDLTNTRSLDEQRVLDKAAELAEALYRQTPAGQRAAEVRYDRMLKAMHDESFQAFKALVPGLIPPKRGRKPKPTPPAIHLGTTSGQAVPAGAAATQRTGGEG